MALKRVYMEKVEELNRKLDEDHKLSWLDLFNADRSLLPQAELLAAEWTHALQQDPGFEIAPVTMDLDFVLAQQQHMFNLGLDAQDAAHYQFMVSRGITSLVTHDTVFASRAENMNVYTANDELISSPGLFVFDTRLPK